MASVFCMQLQILTTMYTTTCLEHACLCYLRINSLKILVNNPCNMCRAVQDGKAGTDAGAEVLNVTVLAIGYERLVFFCQICTQF